MVENVGKWCGDDAHCDFCPPVMLAETFFQSLVDCSQFSQNNPHNVHVVLYGLSSLVCHLVGSSMWYMGWSWSFPISPLARTVSDQTGLTCFHYQFKHAKFFPNWPMSGVVPQQAGTKLLEVKIPHFLFWCFIIKAFKITKETFIVKNWKEMTCVYHQISWALSAVFLW